MSLYQISNQFINELEQMSSLKHLRDFMEEKGLELLIDIYPSSSQSIRWNIMKGAISGNCSLNLSAMLRKEGVRSSLCQVSCLFPFTFNQEGLIDQDELFQELKKALLKCLREFI